MKPCSQTKDWCVSLFGETLPKYILYGNVNHKFFTCDIFTGKFETPAKRTAYVIKVRNMKRDRWETRRTNEGFADIYLAIESYCKNNKIVGNKIEVCPHKKYWAEKSREAHEKFVARGVLRAEEESREIQKAGPQTKKANYDFSLYGAWGANSCKVGAVETANVYTYEAEGCHPYAVEYTQNKKGEYVLTYDQCKRMFASNFEMGQTSSGTVNGAYTRSGFEIKKDGILDTVNAVKQERAEKARNTRTVSGNVSGISMDKLARQKYDKALEEVKERFGSVAMAEKNGYKDEACVQECLYYERNYRA